MPATSMHPHADTTPAPRTTIATDLSERLRAVIALLPDLDDPAFADAFDRDADRRVVLLGDARHTGMGSERGELNLGQLCGEAFGDEAALIGFGTHTHRPSPPRTAGTRRCV